MRQGRARRAAEAREADHVLLARRLAEVGVRDVRHVLIHENRRVMVHVARDTLRLHRGFAYAPDRVLRAIAAFLGARSGRARRDAERELLAFPVHDYVPAAPAPRRAARTARPGDRRVVEALASLHQELNRRHFDGRLSTPRFRLSDRMRTRLAEVLVGDRRAGPIEIGVSRRHLGDGWEEVTKTLLHEMVHQWQVESGHSPDHGVEFRRKAREIGIEATARRHVRPAARRPRTE
jgi:hypothetical protein